MEFLFSARPETLRVLVVADPDVSSATQLTELFVPSAPRFDAVVVCGPFCYAQNQSAVTAEEKVLARGEIGSTVAQFENIVCRVVYLGASTDPADIVKEQLFLTPNSVNVNQRRLQLTEDLFVVGFSETADNLTTSGLPADFDRSPESDDELDGVEVKSGSTSIKTIEDLLQAATAKVDEEETQTGGGGGGEQSGATTTATATATSAGAAADKKITGIFALNYKFAHTLNHFLFHMADDLEKAGVKICILPPELNTPEPARLPSKFGGLAIAALGSLRLKGYYTVLDLARRDGEWDATIELKTLPRP